MPFDVFDKEMKEWKKRKQNKLYSLSIQKEKEFPLGSNKKKKSQIAVI